MFAVRIAMPFVITRTILLIAGFLALTQMPRTHDEKRWEVGPDGQIHPVHLAREATTLSTHRYWAVNIFSRWDAGWYLDIVKHGYHYRPDQGLHANTAFFPLYPVLITAGTKLLGPRDVSILFAGILISNISLLIALGYLAALVRLEFGEEIASRGVFYLLVFPSTLFFSAVYTESLFLAAALIAFYYARRGRWSVAGVAGAAAALTRAPGILISVALVLEYLQQRDFQWRNVRADLAALALIPVALGLHFAYLGWKFGNFWLFLQTEKDWGRPLIGAPGRFASFAHFAGGDLFATLLTLISIVVAWRYLRPSYALYATLAFLMPLASGSLLGMGRFCLVIFPLYIVLAIAGANDTFNRYWLILSSALAVLFMVLFSQWHFVG
jgi:hypothetical protein